MSEPMRLDWEHVYLLGWFDRAGMPHLTSWSGERPIIKVVVTGPWEPFGPPLWAAAHNAAPRCGGQPVEAFALHAVPPDTDPRKHALKMGGCVAIGWHIEDGFMRTASGT